MKKLISTNTLSIIALAMTLCLAACGKKAPGSNPMAGIDPDSNTALNHSPIEAATALQGLSFDIQQRCLRSCADDSMDLNVVQQVLPLVFHASGLQLKKDDTVQVDSLLMHWHADDNTGKWQRFQAKTRIKVNAGNWTWLDMHEKAQADTLATVLTSLEGGCPLGESCAACYAQRNNCKLPCLAYVATDGIIIAVVSDIFDK